MIGHTLLSEMSSPRSPEIAMLSHETLALPRRSMLPAFLDDVQVDTGVVAESLPDATSAGILWEAAPGRFLLRVPEVGRFSVEAGNKIIIDPAPYSKLSDTSRFLRMTPLAALVYQRGCLAFHAAAACHSGGAILLAGNSGAGKSALLMALLERGWAMLADEVAAVDLDSGGRLQVWPSFPEIEFWPHPMLRAGEQPEQEITQPLTTKLRSMAVAEKFLSTPRPLCAIFWLSAHNAGQIELRAIEGMARFRASGTLAYNSHIADVLLNRSTYLWLASALAQTVPVQQLRRPRGRWNVEEVADKVEAACKRMGWKCTECKYADMSSYGRQSRDEARVAGTAE